MGSTLLFERMLGHYLAYYRPGYHPWDRVETTVFAQWRRAYEECKHDPITATERFFAAAC